MSTTDDSKRQLRRQLSARRRAIAPERKRELDRQMTAALLELDEYINAPQVLCYASTQDEPDTYALIADALGRGKAVFCPRCTDMDGHMDFYRIESLSQLREGAYSIMEPDPEECKMTGASEFDADALCVVPGLSFDRQRMRLGYGKGYYDRFLAVFRGKTAGMCSTALISDELPTDSYDRSVDIVVTEHGVLLRRI